MQCSPDDVYQRINQQQRDAICAKFCSANPHWKGAGFADILDVLDNGDANLSDVEDAWDKFPALHCRGFGIAVLALLYSDREVNEPNLKSLLIG
jgi:hypothetical protein